MAHAQVNIRQHTLLTVKDTWEMTLAQRINYLLPIRQEQDYDLTQQARARMNPYILDMKERAFAPFAFAVSRAYAGDNIGDVAAVKQAIADGKAFPVLKAYHILEAQKGLYSNDHYHVSDEYMTLLYHAMVASTPK